MSETRAELARRVLGLIDLTDLNATSSDTAVAALCAKGSTPFGKVAAICIWPRFVKGAKPLLHAGVVLKLIYFIDVIGSHGDCILETSAGHRAAY